MNFLSQGGPISAVHINAPSVLASAATGVIPFIERNKGDVDRIFGHCGLAAEAMGSPTLQLSLASYCKLFEVSARMTRNDNFGLWFGNQFNPRDLGLWGYASLSAPTLGDALRTLVDLFPLHQQSSLMTLGHNANGLIALEYRIEAPEIADRRQDAELSLGIFFKIIREALGTTWSPEEVHFEHPRPEGKRDHERAFGTQVYFSQRTNALLLRPEQLSVPMPGRDATLQAAMRHYLERLSTTSTPATTVTDRVRSVVRSRLAEGMPSLQDVATELRISVNVIRRELNHDGLTYRELVELIRRDLAMSYIRQRQLPFSQIAFLLAYSEVSAFSRAVQRWTGLSPREMRKVLTSAEPNT